MNQLPNKTKWYDKIQARLKEERLARKVKTEKRKAKRARRQGAKE